VVRGSAVKEKRGARRVSEGERRETRRKEKETNS